VSLIFNIRDLCSVVLSLFQFVDLFKHGEDVLLDDRADVRRGELALDGAALEVRGEGLREVARAFRFRGDRRVRAQHALRHDPIAASGQAQACQSAGSISARISSP